MAGKGQDRGDPLAETGRIAALDVLRGIAVLGILIPNIMAFGQPLDASFAPTMFRTDPGPFSDQLWLAQFILVDGKMRGLFALLFGAGMMLFVRKSWAKGETRLRQARRLIILAGFGFAHAVLLWQGDILFAYAMVGLLVLPFVHLSPLRLGAIGAATGLVGAAFYAATLGPLAIVAAQAQAGAQAESGLVAEIREEELSNRANAAREARAIEEGDYAAFVASNWEQSTEDPLGDAIYSAFELFPLMLLGAALFAAGFLSGGAPPAPVRKAAVAACVLGFALTAMIGWFAVEQGLTFWATWAAVGGWVVLPQLLLVVALAVLLAPVAGRSRGWLAQWLAGAGKTAFTNYIGTSLAMLFVFHGFGLGLFGRFNRIELYAVVPLAWAVMLVWPQLWLARFRYGPLEWLWRCLTYGQWVPLRR